MKELVRKARSIRRFDESNPVTEETLRSFVDMARITPSAANKQILRYKIVTSEEERNKLFPCLMWAGALKDWVGPKEGEQPTGYIIILSTIPAGVDTGIAAQTIQLGSAEAGYGSCMLGAIDRDKIKETLKIPEQYNVNLVIALGKPAENVVIEDVPEGSDLNYYRTPDKVHHVPKLRLDDILL